MTGLLLKNRCADFRPIHRHVSRTLCLLEQQRLAEFDMEQQRVNKLIQETRALETQIQTLEIKQQQHSENQKELTGRLDSVQSDLERLSRLDESSADIQALTDERNALEEEYRLLLEIYREISQ